MKAMAGVLQRYEESFKKLYFDKLKELLPFFMVLAEMIKEPDVMEFLIDSITSPDDLLAWIDYLNLPSEGWDGVGAPPPVEIAGADYLPSNSDSETYRYLANALIPTAYAGGKRAKAVDPSILLARLNKFLEQIDKDLRTHAPEISQSLKKAVELLKAGEGKAFRAIVFNPKFIAAVSTLGVRVGYKHLENFIKGRSDARLSPVMVVAIIAFLEEQFAKGEITEEVHDIILQKYALAFVDIIFGDLDEEQPYGKEIADPISKTVSTFKDNGAHGALFHLQMVAYYRLLNKQIEALEAHRRVKFFLSDIAKKPMMVYDRNVDIVLKEGDNEQWYEVKSLKSGSSATGSSYSVASDGFSLWGHAREKGKSQGEVRQASFKYHKQFTLDRAAETRNAFEVKNRVERPVTIGPYGWWFQQFKVKNAQGKVEQNPKLGTTRPAATSPNNIRYRLTRDPLPNLDAKSAETGADSMLKYMLGSSSEDDRAKKIQLATLSKLIEESVKNEALDFGEEILEQLRNL